MQSSSLRPKLQKSLDFLNNELSTIRAGRASTSVLEDFSIEAYGSKMSLKELGSISLLDSQTLMITPWDKSLISQIAKDIRESDLNLNPTEDGDVIRIPIPPLTEERRIELAKLVAKKVEESKQSLRSIRQEGMKELEKAFLEGSISEDAKFTTKDEIEKIVKEFVSLMDTAAEAKKTDLMTI